MTPSMEEIYQQRLTRYVTAMRNGMPDKVPVRPFAAEITARHAGFTCQEVTHDYRKAFEAIIRCCTDYDWDATVPNMVYVWTGLTQTIGLRYYGVPGIDVGADVCFQYREPPEQDAFMKREEYDELIADPVRFLYETWLPRVSTEVSAKGEPASYRNNLSFVKGGMAMWNYFLSFGGQIDRMRNAEGAARHPGRQTAGLRRARFRPDGDSREGAGGMPGSDAAPWVSGFDGRGSR